MCGISGIFHLNGQPVEKNDIETMNQTMIHRGPDGQGIFTQAEIGLGHRRLSIIDLEAGKQPMSNADGSIQVVFNGEIYNYLELKKELEAKGYQFRTRSDTESIIYAYEAYGDSFVEKLRGMFAIGLWDSRNKKLILTRDRVGKKPLYYYLDQHRIVFASELKAVIALPGIPKELDIQALDAYLSFGYVPSPLSIFKHIRKLPPASVAVCTTKSFNVREYWNLDMTQPDLSLNDDSIEELEAIFDESVRLRLMSDVPLGAFLSGGVDSSAVVASMSRLMGNARVKTASIGFSEKKFNELEYAEIVAKHCNADHSEFVVQPDALSILDKLVWHLDEPFADSSAIPTYYVSQMARKKVTVALSGDGGDETFAGYVGRYSMNRFEDSIRRKIPPIIRQKVLAPLAAIYPRRDDLPRPLRLKRFLANLSLPIEQAYFRDMSFYFLPEMKKELYTPDTAKAIGNFNAFDVLGKHFAANQNPDPVTRVQYVDIKTYMTEDILVKVDRMSMANSLEVRAPILDHKLMEFAGRLSSDFKLRGKTSKYIFKKMNERRLPADILYRKKQGFSIPMTTWMRHDLREFAREKLFAGSALSQHFNMKYVKQLWDENISGHKDHSTSLWGLMMFEMWHKTFSA